MRKLLVGDCSPETTFYMVDPDAPSEAEFEFAVVRALACAFPAYHCVLFGGTFVHSDSGARRPDLALVARDFSHWFVVEVELTSHSLESHVLPQVRAFCYGTPQADCAGSLSRNLEITREQAQTLLAFVPSSVAVIANRYDQRWADSLAGLGAQLLVVSLFETEGGQRAAEVDGTLRVFSENLGFGSYSATDRSLRFSLSTRLPDGMLQLVDERSASVGNWLVARTRSATWVTKETGLPDLHDGCQVQILKTFDGQLFLRIPI